jgi:hypothetical protein
MLSITTKLSLLALVTIVLLAACGGGDDDDAPEDTGNPTAGGACEEQVVSEPIEADLLPIVISSDHAIGENRFVVGVIDQATEQQVTGADLHLEFVCFDSEDPDTAFEADPEAVVLTKTYTHTHEDGVIETHEAGEAGAYVSYVEFDREGIWGVSVSGETDDGREIGPVRPTFSVQEEPAALAPGDPAPQTVQPLVGDVADIRDIDTSESPIPEQHDKTIADAVTSGKPTVIAFATPAFCQSQICGPMKEIFDDLYTQYGTQANFVHIEPYEVAKMRAGQCQSLGACLVPAVEEWGLTTEPWVFVVDAEGKVSARFDSIASYEEIEAALNDVLAS